MLFCSLLLEEGVCHCIRVADFPYAHDTSVCLTHVQNPLLLWGAKKIIIRYSENPAVEAANFQTDGH